MTHFLGMQLRYFYFFQFSDFATRQIREINLTQTHFVLSVREWKEFRFHELILGIGFRFY